MELTAQKRDVFGKATKVLRKKGLIPAELYGGGLENLHLSVPAKDLRKAFKIAGSNAIVNIMIDGKPHPVLMHDIQKHPVSDEFLNVDFYQVRLDEKIKVRVPLEFVGIAPAVKDKGGVLVKAMQELEVEALPTNLPQSIKVDVGSLAEIGQSVRIKDLAGGAEFKVMADPETALATVIEKVSEEKEAVMAQAVDVEAVKVETEEKKSAREAGKAAEGASEEKTAK